MVVGGIKGEHAKVRACRRCSKQHAPSTQDPGMHISDVLYACGSVSPGLTEQTGEWLRPAFMPVTPQVRTAPRPLVLKEDPKQASILSFTTWVTSSRHRLVMAVWGEAGGDEGREGGSQDTTGKDKSG